MPHFDRDVQRLLRGVREPATLAEQPSPDDWLLAAFKRGCRGIAIGTLLGPAVVAFAFAAFGLTVPDPGPWIGTFLFAAAAVSGTGVGAYNGGIQGAAHGFLLGVGGFCCLLVVLLAMLAGLERLGGLEGPTGTGLANALVLLTCNALNAAPAGGLLGAAWAAEAPAGPRSRHPLLRGGVAGLLLGAAAGVLIGMLQGPAFQIHQRLALSLFLMPPAASAGAFLGAFGGALAEWRRRAADAPG